MGQPCSPRLSLTTGRAPRHFERIMIAGRLSSLLAKAAEIGWTTDTVQRRPMSNEIAHNGSADMAALEGRIKACFFGGLCRVAHSAKRIDIPRVGHFETDEPHTVKAKRTCNKVIRMDC